MKKTARTWKKSIILICGFIAIGAFISCCNLLKNFDEALNDFSYASGYVYGDLNGDGTIDSNGELGKTEFVPGIKVTVYRGNYVPEVPDDPLLEEKNQNLGSDITNENGFYSITFAKAYPNAVFIYKLEDTNTPATFKSKVLLSKLSFFELDRIDSKN